MHRLTAHVKLRYRLAEKPTSTSGFILERGESIHITEHGLSLFHAVDTNGVPTMKYSVTPWTS